jgi:hypothetical protein
MHPDSRKPFAASFKKIIGGVVTLAMLAPVPVMAINFQGLNWTHPAPSGTSLFSGFTFDSSSTDQTVLTFTLQDGTVATATDTFTSGPLTVDALHPGTTLNGTWQGLSRMNFSIGSVQIQIGVSPSINNMFNSPTYMSAPPDSPTINSSPVVGGTSQITVTFTSDTAFISTGSDASTTFRLTFTN